VGIVPGVLLLIRTLLTVFVQLLSPRARLVAENLVLRQQLIIVQRVVRRPRLKPWERRLLSAFAVRWTALQDAISIVKPATLLRWHRAAWRWGWRRESNRPPGRPPISPELARAHPTVLARERDLGPEGHRRGVRQARVDRLAAHRREVSAAPSRPRRGQSWSAFLHNHLSQVWACDFFTIVSVRFRVLYGFVILSLERSKIVHVGVTEHPTAAWAAQRVVEAIGDRVVPHYLLHDRDMIYGEEFRLARARARRTRARHAASCSEDERLLRGPSARCGVTAWITCSFGTIARPSGCYVNTCATTTDDHIVVCACNRPLARNGSPRRAHRRRRVYVESLSSVACTIATALLATVLDSSDDILTPDNGAASFDGVDHSDRGVAAERSHVEKVHTERRQPHEQTRIDHLIAVAVEPLLVETIPQSDFSSRDSAERNSQAARAFFRREIHDDHRVRIGVLVTISDKLVALQQLKTAGRERGMRQRRDELLMEVARLVVDRLVWTLNQLHRRFDGASFELSFVHQTKTRHRERDGRDRPARLRVEK
jgi:hypothetical protein